MSADFLPLPHSRGKSGEDWPLGVECAWPAAVHAPPAVARPRARGWPLWPAAVDFAVSLWQLGQGGYIQAKAWLAPRRNAAPRRHRESHLKGNTA